MLHHWDLVVFHAVNGWCGNWALDRIVGYQQGSPLVGGGLILTCYWWFWFTTPESRRNERRRTVVAALIGVFLTLVASRLLAASLPFRLRPMYVAGIGYHAPSISIPTSMENWSSFPSDTAAYYLALAYGLYRLSRPLSLLLLTYAAVWICLPRLYLGIHYASDLLAGGALGIVIVAASVRMLNRDTRFVRRLTHAVARSEQRHPQLFYAVAFALSLEMSMTFDDVREFIHASLHGLRMAGYASMREETIFLILLGLMLVGSIVAWAGWRAMQRPSPNRRDM